MIEYFDLKRNPDLIPHVPELRDRPELQNFVTELNKPTSIFRTLRCEARCTCNPHDAQYCQTHWHFTFAFEIVGQNQLGNYDEFNNLLKTKIAVGARNRNIAFDLRHVHTSYRDHGVTNWSQDIEIFGFGKTESDSEKEFLFALRLLRNFFYEESRKWYGKLSHGRATIS